MKRLSTFVLAAVFSAGFTAVAAAGGPSGGGGNEQPDVLLKRVRIISKYGGVCHVSRTRRTKQYKIIRNRSQLRRFVKTIPKYEIGRGRMPRSNDPLLRMPRVNFRRHVLLVTINSNPLRYKGPYIKRVVQTQRQIKVYYTLKKRPRYPMQWPAGVGYYRAVLIKKSSKYIRFYLQ